MVPFVSALISGYVTLPLKQEDSFKAIMTLLFILAWLTLAHIISAMPNEVLQKLKLTQVASNKVMRYWIVAYKRNKTTAYSILQICDDCGSNTKSCLRDYNKDLSLRQEMGVQRIDFNGDEQLSQIYTKGGNKFSFIRFDFMRQNAFDIARIDDNGKYFPRKITGFCEAISTEMLRKSGICEDEKLARKMLSRFSLSKANFEALLVYISKNEETDFPKEIMNSYDLRRNSEVVSADSGFRTSSLGESTANEDELDEEGSPTKQKEEK